MLRGLFEIARAHFALKAFAQARQFAEAALDARRGPFPEAHIVLANALMNLREYPEAARHLAVFLKLAPDSPSAPPARAVLEEMKRAGVPMEPPEAQ